GPVAAGLFFFGSRGGHTRLVSDWSSDVCSSDLILVGSLLHSSVQWPYTSQLGPARRWPPLAHQRRIASWASCKRLYWPEWGVRATGPGGGAEPNTSAGPADGPGTSGPACRLILA